MSTFCSLHQICQFVHAMRTNFRVDGLNPYFADMDISYTFLSDGNGGEYRALRLHIDYEGCNAPEDVLNAWLIVRVYIDATQPGAVIDMRGCNQTMLIYNRRDN